MRDGTKKLRRLMKQIEDAHTRLFAELRALREENATYKNKNDSLTV